VPNGAEIGAEIFGQRRGRENEGETTETNGGNKNAGKKRKY
jgi:hypothetical protein